MEVLLNAKFVRMVSFPNAPFHVGPGCAVGFCITGSKSSISCFQQETYLRVHQQLLIRTGFHMFEGYDIVHTSVNRIQDRRCVSVQICVQIQGELSGKNNPVSILKLLL